MSEHRPEVADVFRTYGDDFLALWERVLSRPQRKAFDDIRACRTAALGGHQAAEHAGQRTMGRPSGRRLVRHSPSLPAHKGRS